MYIPKGLPENQIYGCAASRNNGRIPILAYFNSELNIAIWRSSEPNLDLMSRRSIEDENYLRSLNSGTLP
jgi:hypothetical protein